MYFSYNNQDGTKVSLVYSVFKEMIMSLHVLSDDTHHNCRREWSTDMLAKMSRADVENIKNYCVMTNRWINFSDFLDNKTYWEKSVPEIIEAMEKMSVLEFYTILFTDIYPPKVIERALLSLNIAPEISKEHRYIFLQPEKERAEVLKFLNNYYSEFFAEEIKQIEPLYLRKLKHTYKIVKENDIFEFVHTLHPRIENTDEKLNFHKYKLFEVYKDDLKELVIFITSFGMPHLFLGTFEGGISITLPLYITNYDTTAIPEDRVDVFKAIADKTRLQIIKLLYESPNSTQLLAEKLKLSEAAISKNLKLLYKSNIVSKERDGNYVNYHLNVNVIDSLVYLLYEVIAP